MLAKYPLSNATPEPVATTSPVATVRLPGPDISELIHLAHAVLLKSPQDLGAIIETVPALTENWLDVFTAERARAEAEAKFWSSAIAYLMAAAPCTIANDG